MITFMSHQGQQIALKCLNVLGLSAIGAIAPIFFSPICAVPALAQTSTLTEKILTMERSLEQEFETYFGEDLAEVTQTPADIAATLSRLGAETGTAPAVLWAIPRGDHLHLVLITPNGEPVVRDLYDVPDRVLSRAVGDFRSEVTNPRRNGPMVGARQLHQWLIEPFAAEYLDPAEIDTILFCLGKGLRGIPVTALYDGEHFLIERYNLARIPAFNLIQTDYEPLDQRQILVTGASEFENQEALPAVPTEIATILQALEVGGMMADDWEGRSLLNEEFTLAAFEQDLQAQPLDVVHLATHAEFLPGDPQQSYIQFWDTQVGLDVVDDVSMTPAPLELLVLSACRTVLGDDGAELGFAGLALKSGVKSAIASLWYVSDFGTLALMSDLYEHLGHTTTKAAALRQAQVNMINGTVRVEGNELVLSGDRVLLPAELQNSGISNLSHPFYWAGFTLISSPW